MKKKTFILLALLLTTMLACSLAGGGADSVEAPAVEAPAESAPVEEAEEAPAEEASVDTEFPLPDDAKGVTEVGNGTINFQTGLSIPDVATFYRMAYPNYTEREIVTIAEEGSLNLVFDGHESGKAIVIQGFPLGDGMNNVSIRLE